MLVCTPHVHPSPKERTLCQFKDVCFCPSFQMLDYEEVPNIYLSIGVRNKAEFHHSVASQFQMHSTPVRIQVVNVREGPTFRPSSMTFSLREGVRGDSLMNYVLGTYTAIDTDTGNPATNVRYGKALLPCSVHSCGVCYEICVMFGDGGFSLVCFKGL